MLQNHMSSRGLITVAGGIPSIKEAATLLAELGHFAEHEAMALFHHHSSPYSLSLADAYQECERITRIHSKSFFFSSQFLPPEKRQAIRALYAFCRVSDDIVDQPAQSNAATALAAWVALVRAPAPPPHHPVLLAWHDTIKRYHIPAHLVDELLAGIAMDLRVSRYQSFAELWVYCYRVASVVGLMSMHIIGYVPEAADQAIQLGIALQLTNILRDVGEDAERGRIYLPQEDLHAYGLSKDEVLAGCLSKDMRAMLMAQIVRADSLYDSSWPGVKKLPGDSQLAVGAAAQVYRGILREIEATNYDVFRHRASVPLLKKLYLLAQVRQRLQREK